MREIRFRGSGSSFGGAWNIWRLLLLCALFCCSSVVGQYEQYQDQYGFTCQGTSEINAMNNCPDRGAQRGSAGEYTCVWVCMCACVYVWGYMWNKLFGISIVEMAAGWYKTCALSLRGYSSRLLGCNWTLSGSV